ncbi:hypothetical protein OB2597_00700 [Pseudooceanicola batsensis HTCC2597]|uniref:DUF421 domain-containing protein n=1 Tax=Pseudooceanicola batsensis (strain ATCC BAA-863 / DSM 15984 / KCTC 12145 / HTCC2597) TaxID=252305 RepID=A3U1V7_PSEBH|nr:YetF domain-containing protein [Pseudooceanicola batsensis]EAQ01891.1 hypothetical protein OB2597_00700 [Pseudooceanicola batsensis HTCC2597]
MTEDIIFQGWSGVMRVLIVGSLAYAYLIVLLRVSGKRTLAKLNAFDLVVTVAIGSTLATILLSNSVALIEGITALTLLAVLQFCMAWLSVRSRWFARAVRSEPTLLLRDGQLCHDAMRRVRVTEEELMTVLRANGHSARPDQAAAIILESDGSFSVLGAGETSRPARKAAM